MTHRSSLAPSAKTVTPIAVALQGGGAWGAFTWGVLDRLLARRDLRLRQFSGTSAGAINAAIVASGLAIGGPAEARRRLDAFWSAVAGLATGDLLRRLFWTSLAMTGREAFSAWLSEGALPSPYLANPLNINPLRHAVAAHVDIDALRSPQAPELFVTVTHVRSGLPRILANAELSIDALMASACLPQLFQAVEIDGEAYWDGGFCGNPTLWPLIRHGPVPDIVLVQLSPDSGHPLPTDTQEIHRRMGEIIFNSSLVAEMQAIHAIREASRRGGDADSAFLQMRLHRIGPPPQDAFANGHAADRSWPWLQRLRNDGHAAATQFLARHRRNLGVRETLAIRKHFFGQYKPRLRMRQSRPEAAS